MSLYQLKYHGLKRAPKEWHKTFSVWITGEGLIQSVSEPCMFFSEPRDVALVLYVDDLLIAGQTDYLMNQIVEKIQQKFKLRVILDPSYFLGMNMLYRR
jgi:Reverse transcriptase (RNA-dependent DNA polymerase)